MKEIMNKKAIKAAAIELEKMIDKYINDYPEVQQLKNCYAGYIEMAKKGEINAPCKNVHSNPYWFTDTPLGELGDLDEAYSEFDLRITLDNELYEELMSL